MPTVHLIRHGEVENPKGVIYGRLPGYHLSERGKEQARGAAQRLARADIGVVFSSPMERAVETAEIVAAPHSLEVVTDDRLIESETTLEGVGRTLGSFVRSPANLWSLRNPLRPTWGETFKEIKARMVAAVNDAMDAAGGRETVCVSHQTPVLVARLAIEGRSVPPWLALERRGAPPWLAFTPCETGSITTLVVEDGEVVSASYFSPRTPAH